MYVNTTNGNLDLSQGAVSIALLKAAGKSLQQECKKAAPIKVGDVAFTSSGNIPCHYIFHTVMPSYKKHSSEAEKVCNVFVNIPLCINSTTLNSESILMY